VRWSKLKRLGKWFYVLGFSQAHACMMTTSQALRSGPLGFLHHFRLLTYPICNLNPT
jgi:hypothetical protein